MIRLSTAEELERTADRITEVSRGDLQIILRRAALVLRNVSGISLDPATGDALDSIATEMKIGRTELIQIILRAWLETNPHLPVRMLNEESETDGTA